MPITLNNYTFSNVVFEIEENTNVSNQHATGVLTISPLEGYSVTASDFSLDPSFSDPNVTSVVFTQSGDNVLCTVTFDTSFVMPSANVNIDLCIIGQGVAVERSISGFVTATVHQNLDSGDGDETLTPYSNTGSISSTETLFTRTYTADTGYYFLNQPIVSIITGNQAHYNIVQTPTYDANNNATSYLVTVNYQYPTSDVSGDFIKIDVPKSLVGTIYSPQPRLTGYVFNTSAISNAEEVRTLTVVGEPGTTFSATLNDGTTTTTIINNEDIGSNGRYEHDITFPALTKGNPNVTYTITISTAAIDAIEQPNPIIVKQLNEVDLAIIAPAGKEGMIKHAEECFERKIPFIFDPGQGLPMFNKDELNNFINQATYVAVNDYEAELLMKVSELSLTDIQNKVDALIVTKGAQGSEIYTDKKIIIDPILADTPIDPTGCGDAYRAGLLYGVVNNLTWEETGKLASVMGSIKIKTQGAQNHNPSIPEIEGLYGKKLI